MALVLSAAQMRALDRTAIERWGVPGVVLMENAGRGVAEVILRARPRLAGRAVVVVCGAGQNGGDGFVIARHLQQHGARVRVLLAAPRGKITGDAAVFAAVVEAMGSVPVLDLSDVTDADDWRARLEDAEVLVDALFGTGLRADVTGAPAAAIAAMNAAAGLRVAVDVPSGLDADTGRTRGIALAADLTATMAARKLGLVIDPTAPVGDLQVVDIGVSPALLLPHAGLEGPLCHWTEEAEIAALVPRPGVAAHKGTRGHVLVVAGSAGKTGAAWLAGRAALRAGAGLVTVATTAEGQRALDAKVAELMTARYTDGEDADGGSYDRLAALADRMTAVVVGPGIPTGPGAAGLVRRLTAELPRPLVIDADGLNLLGTDAPAVLRGAPAARVLTPHPGEMARLVGASTAAVQADRLAAARRLSAASGAVVVLKGARTVIATPNGTAHVNPAATASLATAGSGDVLTGLLGALLGQGLLAEDAARVAVNVHGRAATRARRTLGARHLAAGDLPDAIARVLEHDLRRTERADRHRRRAR